MKLNKKHMKSSMVFSNKWLTLFASFFCLNPGCAELNITGRLNKDVILPCNVKYKDEFNYSLLVINWQRAEDDSVVHTFFQGSSQGKYQDSSYQARTHIFYEALPEGNASLLLKRLTKSDAGFYTCHVILREATGYTTQHVKLTVEDIPELICKKRLWISPFAFAILPLTLCFYIMLRKYNSKLKYEQIIKKYREFMKCNTYKTTFPRQLLVLEHHFSTSQHNISFGEKNTTVNADELFTPGNKHLMSKRMLLLGNAGTGKSYLCKWLEHKWLRKDKMLYKCIIYVSCERMSMENVTSIKAIVKEIYSDLPEVLHMSEVLLILDGLDHISYGEKKVSIDVDNIEEHPEKKETFDIDVLFELKTLVENIIMRKLLPETDVLIVSRHDLAISKLGKCRTFILQDLNVAIIAEKLSKNITDVTYNPAFVVMMLNLTNNQTFEYTSPYEFLTGHLRYYMRDLKVGTTEGDSFRQLASQSYRNLVEGLENESTEQWKRFLGIFSCQDDFKYQCNILRDMLAALHCTWEIRKGEKLKDCLDFWVNGSNARRYSVLLKHAAKQHNTKYYHFIRFFMRLLPSSNDYPGSGNAPDMDDNMRKEMTDFFKAKMKDHSDNYEKLQLIHCVFELHDEHVTNELSSSVKQFTLFNTPLNALDIRALAYFLRNVKLEELDLRLCELTDRDVKWLESIIKNTKYVSLSCNNLTLKTGRLLEVVLKETDCCIERLSYGTNNLGPNGAQALWRSLKDNTSLKSLYLYDNNIGDEGTVGMVDHLQKNHSLRELHLCHNVFSDEGIKNIQTLKVAKPELRIVIRISEDMELFEYVEERVNDLKDTHMNYDQGWLIKLLEAVQADLEHNSGDADSDPSQQKVKALFQEINDIKKTIKKPAKKYEERIKSKLITIRARLESHTNQFSV